VSVAAQHRLVDLGSSTISVRLLAATRSGLPTLVFLHEGLGSLASWRDVPDVLAQETGCRAIVASRRGYGDSSPHPGPWPASFLEDEAANELPALLGALDIDDVILIGHSDGGSIALLFAASSGTTRVRGLVLAAPHVFVEECCVEAIRSLTVDFGGSALQQSLRRLHGGQADVTFAAWTGVWLAREFRDWNCHAALPFITCPTLVFQGDADPYGTDLQTEALARNLAGELEIVPLADCGHHPHRERREEFIDRTRAFLLRTAAAW
jgi:pimeloyl-ACP methyl ester carboxylesterase